MNFHLTGMNSAFCIFLMGNMVRLQQHFVAALPQILTSQKYCAEICIHFHLLYGRTFQALWIRQKIMMTHTTRYGTISGSIAVCKLAL